MMLVHVSVSTDEQMTAIIFLISYTCFPSQKVIAYALPAGQAKLKDMFKKLRKKQRGD